MAPLALWTLAFALAPRQAAYQDLGALLAHQPGVAERAHKFLLESPFGTIHAATFSLPRPIGTAIPHPPVYALANFDPFDITGSIGEQVLADPNGPLQFPTVNRKDKRDSLLHRKRAPMPPLPAALPIEAPAQSDAAIQPDGAGRFDRYSDYEFATPIDEPPNSAPASPGKADKPVVKHSNGAKRGDRQPMKTEAGDDVFFGSAPMVGRHEALRPYAPGEAPVVKSVPAADDPDIKLAALTPGADDGKGGQSIAAKGVVTGIDQHPKSPAERLGLVGKPREKAERCLAQAVYFESRDEPVRAQIAVAQVVMNRVFSPFYPNSVCGVVYQNANRHLACQFTFACDGVPDVVTEPDAWERAKHIARDVLDGKLWMPEVAKSTHYHDWYVHPSWVGEMRRMDRLGGLIFYRPRAWGNGANEPSWGDAKTTEKEIKKM